MASEVTNNKLNTSKRADTLDTMVLALFIAFTFGIFAPLEFYFTNINDLWFDIYDILPHLLVLTLCAFILVASLLAIMSKIRGASKVTGLLKPSSSAQSSDTHNSLYGIVMTVLIILSVSLYIQGNFLEASYDKLGGETIDWSMYTAEGISNVCGWVGMLAIFAVLLYKLKLSGFIRVFRTVMICILLVQISTLIIVGVSRHGLMHKDDYVATTENEWTLSKDDNYIVLLLDTYDARIFDELLDSDRGDDYRAKLEDFTFYRNTLTVFTLTDFSIPQILTGQKYLNEEDYGPYIERAYAGSPFLNRLHDDGYIMDVYTTVTLPQTGAREWMENWHKVDYVATDSGWLIGMLYRLIAFRYAPHYLKVPLEFNVELLDDVKTIGTIDGHKYIEGTDPDTFPWGNKQFVDGIPLMDASAVGEKFIFYHLKGIHHTRDLDEDLSEVTDLGEDGEGVSLEESAKACMTIIDRFLSKLKELETYEDAVIVIMADHGAAGYSGGGKIQSPLLLIKGRGERHGFKISEAPVSYEDMQEGFISLLDGHTDEDVFTVKEGDERTRTMYYTEFIGQRRRFTRNSPFIEYETSGHAFESHLLKKTGREY